MLMGGNICVYRSHIDWKQSWFQFHQVAQLSHTEVSLRSRISRDHVLILKRRHMLTCQIWKINLNVVNIAYWSQLKMELKMEKFINILKPLKKTKVILFPSRLLPCKQNCVHYTLYTTNTDRLRPWDLGHMKDTDVYWLVKMRDWGFPLQQRLSASGPGIPPSFTCTNSSFEFYLDSLKCFKKCFKKSKI